MTLVDVDLDAIGEAEKVLCVFARKSNWKGLIILSVRRIRIGMSIILLLLKIAVFILEEVASRCISDNFIRPNFAKVIKIRIIKKKPMNHRIFSMFVGFNRERTKKR